mgnify:CR=1 FL=1
MSAAPASPMLFDPRRLLLIAGPCSLENEGICRAVAGVLAELRRECPELNLVFKGSFDKANRTSLGGARGTGRVYVQGRHVADTTLTQLSIGFQAGGQTFSQIVFLEDERAFREFSSGQFGFGAGVSAVAITAAASASASTTGATAGVSGGTHSPGPSTTQVTARGVQRYAM